MHSNAYNRGIEYALAEAGYASLQEFAKHGADLAKKLNALPPEQFQANMSDLAKNMPEMAQKIQDLHGNASKDVAEQVKKLQPMGGGLMDKIKGVFSPEPHVPEKAQWFLDEAGKGRDAKDVLQPGGQPGEYDVKRFEMGNIPGHRDASVKSDPNVLTGHAAPDAVSAMADSRRRIVPGWALGGAALGGVAGAGIGHYTADDNASPEDRQHRTMLGGAAGVALGGLGGGLLGALRGNSVGRATIVGKDLAEQAGKAFGK